MYLDCGDRKLYYETAGEGETVVLGHAGFVDSHMWDDQWPAFTQRYRVVRYDMLGFGRSDPATAPISRREELFRLLKSLNIERAHLIGCSMSGSTMIDLALEHPEIVASLTVVSAVPGGFEFRGEPPRQLLEMIDAIQHGDLSRASELQLRLWVDGPFREPGQMDPVMRQHAAEMNRIPIANQTWLRVDSCPTDTLDPPAIRRLDEIRVPVLVVAGALDNPEVVRAAGLMADALPGARKAIISGAAHVPSMEKPTEFNRIVLDFLASASCRNSRYTKS